MIKNSRSISFQYQDACGCFGCIHHIYVPEQLCEYCDLPGDECTHGNDLIPVDDNLWDETNLPTWRECSLLYDNYEYSTSKGVTGMECPPVPLSALQSYIYENEPLRNFEADLFRSTLIAGMNMEKKKCPDK